MRHLCEACSELTISDEAVANLGKPSINSRKGPFVYVFQEVFAPGEERKSGLRYSEVARLGQSVCHLCALILRSLIDSRNIGTAEEDVGLPIVPISLELHIEGETVELIGISGNLVGHPIRVTFNSDDSCRGAHVSSESNSDSVFENIMNWCDDCSQHEQCSRTSNEGTSLPSRVLDVGRLGETPRLKLWETHGHVGRYVTLTHRWTPVSEASRTTRFNFQSRLFSIELSELSETFQDAVEATRKLGIQYLWVDALCIIQDSSDDWKREACNMMSIYELAWLNFAGAGSEGHDGRLFMQRDPQINTPCQLPRGISKLSQIYSGDPGGSAHAYLGTEFHAKGVFEGFLSRRGWTLQERLLSPRTVYFSKGEVYWECNKMIASESIPRGWSTNESASFSKMKFDFSRMEASASEVEDAEKDSPGNDTKISILISKPKPFASIYDYWYKLVETYSNRKLTNPADKLPAILGIAQALHKSHISRQTFNECYYNGIWLADTTRQLLWIREPEDTTIQPNYVISRNSRTSSSRIPSYSWASSKNPVKFLLAEPPDSSHIKDIQPSFKGLLTGPEGLNEKLRDDLPHLKADLPNGRMQVDGQIEAGKLSIEEVEDVNKNLLHIGRIVFKRLQGVADLILDASLLEDQTLSWLQDSRGEVSGLPLATVQKSSLNPDIKWPTLDESSSSHSEFVIGLVLIPNSMARIRNVRTQKHMSWASNRKTMVTTSYRRIGVYRIGADAPPSEYKPIVLA